MRNADKRALKTETLAPIYNMVRMCKSKIRINDIWEDNDAFNLKHIWNTRAYFLQDLKKFVPNDIVIHMAQGGGTFAKLK